ncbi:hypothetical protein HGP14_02775 [Rhizobium sp. P32RR-XVIII]|uniref:hypothetical protein n=1 Tax=Rhizobium sp. P32RR-XVIII TaxID=2726738 RepID=UPI0014572B82|nr:hypothetical protein [Rhizobium sp. P32RR-XVIII]NLS02293.1 hypothetical protein [Rhizobium sp. P32RR-XVIII]
MPWKRKIPNDREELAAHINAGVAIEGIAETYGVGVPAIRRELIRHGLIEARTRTVIRTEAFEREIAPEPTKQDVVLKADRVTFTREFFMMGKGFELRPLSLPRNSMHLATIASRYPNISGGHHAGM